ncbi:MAG: Rho-binding antiterminator [Candidatus Thiodiazotropha sp.]
MNDDYQPVACSQHEVYEYAVLKGSMLDISWHDEDGSRCRARAMPKDVVTRDKAEYLVIEKQDKSIRWIRLDRIIEAEEVSGSDGRLRR